MDITLKFTHLNSSAQVRDAMYYTNPVGVGAFNTSDLESIKQLGIIKSITKDTGLSSSRYVVVVDHQPILGHSQVGLDVNDSFFMFSKNNEVNSTSLLGYYAKVNFVNNSTEKAELFSVGSEISESSK